MKATLLLEHVLLLTVEPEGRLQNLPSDVGTFPDTTPWNPWTHIHCTLWPTTTVAEDGEKAKFTMVIFTPMMTGAVVVGALVVGAVVVGARVVGAVVVGAVVVGAWVVGAKVVGATVVGAIVVVGGEVVVVVILVELTTCISPVIAYV